MDVYGVKVRDKLSGMQMIQRLKLENLITVMPQNRSRWCLILSKDEEEWLKGFVDYEQKVLSCETGQRRCLIQKKDAMVHSK